MAGTCQNQTPLERTRQYEQSVGTKAYTSWTTVECGGSGPDVLGGGGGQVWRGGSWVMRSSNSVDRGRQPTQRYQGWLWCKCWRGECDSAGGIGDVVAVLGCSRMNQGNILLFFVPRACSSVATCLCALLCAFLLVSVCLCPSIAASMWPFVCFTVHQVLEFQIPCGVFFDVFVSD